MTNTEIAALEAEVSRLRRELEVAMGALHRARSKACGIDVGDIVIYKGVEHRVSGVDTRWIRDAKPWLRGNPKKKDGTWGIKDVHMYHDWKRP